MARINPAIHSKKIATLEAMRTDRLPFWQHWRDLSDMYLPRRYVHLMSHTERQRQRRNTRILDSTGTIAARVLASGMMNGITSPSRRWFKLRLAGFHDNEPQEIRIWLDAVEQAILRIMAESNFYNALGIMYLDLSIFGTAAMLVYEDFKSVIRCYNPALGQYYFAQSDREEVNTFAREFTLKVHQVVQRWGLENTSDLVKDAWRQGGARLQQDIEIVHLIEPNVGDERVVGRQFEYREFYWEKSGTGQRQANPTATDGRILSVRGFHELPGVFARWDVTGNEPYGGSPGMDALGDVIQLQHETKAKGQALDKMVRPPLQADIQLQHKPTANLPGGITYVSGLLNAPGGAAMRPVYQVNPPLGEMTQDILQLQGRIREIFHNDLFQMISNLETVRSALEVAERKEEKLVLLGPVLERFESEALDPSITRVFNIANRGGLLPEAPPELEALDVPIEIQYVSILSAAQRAVGTASIERFLQVIGETSAIHPKAINVPNWDTLLHNYGRDIGVPANAINDLETIEALGAAQDGAEQAANEAAIGQQLAEGARTLSDTDVGGGVNALEVLAGNA